MVHDGTFIGADYTCSPSEPPLMVIHQYCPVDYLFRQLGDEEIKGIFVKVSSIDIESLRPIEREKIKITENPFDCNE